MPGHHNFGGKVQITSDVHPLSLNYVLDPSNASAIRQRQTQYNVADRTFYTVSSAPQVMTIQLSKSGYINGSNCYLRFQLGTQKNDGSTPTSAPLLTPSACNIISQFRLRTESSPDIENYQQVNHIVAMRDMMTCSPEYLTTRGAQEGYYKGFELPTFYTNPAATGLRTRDIIYTVTDTGGATGLTAANVKNQGYAVPIPNAMGTVAVPSLTLGQLSDAESIEAKAMTDQCKASSISAPGAYAPYFTIPMSKISGFFAQNRLLPMAVIGGLIIEITFAPFTQAFVNSESALAGKGGTPNLTTYDATQYTVFNPQLVTDLMHLSDEMEKRVQAEAILPDHSLDIAYKTWDVQNRPISASGTGIDLDVPKSLHDVVSVYATVRESQIINGASAPYCSQMKSSACVRQTVVNTLGAASAPSTTLGLGSAYAGVSMPVITGYQWFLNAEQFPTRKVVSTKEIYSEALKAWNLYKLDYGGPSYPFFREHCFNIPLDLETDDNSAFVGKTLDSGSVLHLQVDVTDTAVDSVGLATTASSIYRNGVAGSSINSIGGLMVTFLIMYTRVLKLNNHQAAVIYQ